MEQNQSLFEQELYQRVDEVLHYVWDPVGISRDPFARDEYQSYVPEVFVMLVEDTQETTLMEYLLRAEEEVMGLAPRPSHARRVAELLLDWASALEQKYGEAPQG